MTNIQKFIASGKLEVYCLGMANAEEVAEVEQMARIYRSVRDALEDLQLAMEVKLLQHPLEPSPLIKPFLMATIDLMDRMQKGETLDYPPILQEGSKVSDYSNWLERPDMIPSSNMADIYAKIIGHTPEVTTAIVWLRKLAPEEVHHAEYEKFLVVEGTCTITIENDQHCLKAGDYLAIPLYKHHHVDVTSAIPCKVILQRIAI